MIPVQCIKLINGDELIGKMNQNDDGSITVEKPRVVMVAQTGASQYSIVLIPWIASNVDITINIKSDSIMTEIFPCSKELENQYIQQTSNITIASRI